MDACVNRSLSLASQLCSILFFEIKSLTDLEFTTLTRPAGQDTLEILLPPSSQCRGYRSLSSYLFFYVGAKDLNSCLYAFPANTLLTEPFPQPPHLRSPTDMLNFCSPLVLVLVLCLPVSWISVTWMPLRWKTVKNPSEETGTNPKARAALTHSSVNTEQVLVCCIIDSRRRFLAQYTLYSTTRRASHSVGCN